MRHADRGDPRTSTALTLLCALLVLAVACSPGTDARGPATDGPTPVTPPALGVPDVPVPAAPDIAELPDGDGAGGADAAPADAPEPGPTTDGDTVLLHLEGPLTDRAATDVVIRDEDGSEIERFRLPGAVGVWAAPGASTALIHTLPDGWARYDATTGRLVLVTFPTDVPGPTIQPGAGIAGPAAVWDPGDVRWLLRMDTGVLTDLDPIAADGRLEELGSQGGTAVLRRGDGRLVLVRTGSGEARELDATSAGISGNGLVLAQVTTAGEVVTSAPDGTDRRVLGSAAVDATPVPLPDGRVLLTGAAPAVLGGGPDLVPAPLVPAIPIRRPLRVSADGSGALATGPEGLVLVDLQNLQITPISETAGYAPLHLGPASVLWAASIDPSRPGGIVVDAAARTVIPFLEDVPTVRFSSIAADGRTVTMSVAPAGQQGAPTAVVVDHTGLVTPLAPDVRSEAVLHPGGRTLAIALTRGQERDLRIGPAEGPQVVVSTGRNPVWLQRAGR